jgi:Glycosyltransferase family 87
VQNTITVGQIYGLLVLLAALAYCFHQRRQPVAAAIAIGLLVAFKPTMAFLLPFLWLAHHRRIAWVATGVTCIASALPVLFYGPGIYTQWVAALLGDMHWIGSTDIAPIAILPRHGHPHAGFVLAGGIGLALAWWQWKKLPSFADSCGAAICAGILCAPLAWHIYLFFAAPLYVARRWSLLTAIGACLLLIPLVMVPSASSIIYLTAVPFFF